MSGRSDSNERAGGKRPARGKVSAGVLLYREGVSGPEVLLAHPGGPFWQGKDDGAWSIPKGEIQQGEDERAAALREFSEETGYQPKGAGLSTGKSLGFVRLKGGKTICVWALCDDYDPADLVSNTFQLEWPPHSGQIKEFPEVDRIAWFRLDAARKKILKSQEAFLDRLQDMLTEQS